MNRLIAEAQKIEDIGPPGPTRISKDGTIATTNLGLTAASWDVPKESGEKLIALAEKTDGDGLEIKLGGDPIYAAQEQTGPEGYGFLGAAIVLLIAFGSIVAVGLPLAIALAGLGISTALIGLLALVVDVPDWTTAVSGLIGIGVGIDYALLVLTRFRSALGDGKNEHDAVVEAVTTAGRSVLIAGSTVVIAVLGLFLTGLSYMQGVALSASIAVLVVMLAVSHPAAGAARDAWSEGEPLAYSASSAAACGRPIAPRPRSRWRRAGVTPSSGGPGRRRSSPRRSCSRSRPRPSACGSASPTPATIRRTR